LNVFFGYLSCTSKKVTRSSAGGEALALAQEAKQELDSRLRGNDEPGVPGSSAVGAEALALNPKNAGTRNVSSVVRTRLLSLLLSTESLDGRALTGKTLWTWVGARHPFFHDVKRAAQVS
jgi:hypothetical protein